MTKQANRLDQSPAAAAIVVFFAQFASISSSSFSSDLLLTRAVARTKDVVINDETAEPTKKQKYAQSEHVGGGDEEVTMGMRLTKVDVAR
jgi:hypothetical protein